MGGEERPKPRDDSSTVRWGKGAERGIEARESGVQERLSLDSEIKAQWHTRTS